MALTERNESQSQFFEKIKYYYEEIHQLNDSKERNETIAAFKKMTGQVELDSDSEKEEKTLTTITARKHTQCSSVHLTQPHQVSSAQQFIPQIVKQIRRSTSPVHPREQDKQPMPFFAARCAELSKKTGIDYKQLNILRNPLLPHGLRETKDMI